MATNSQVTLIVPIILPAALTAAPTKRASKSPVTCGSSAEIADTAVQRYLAGSVSSRRYRTAVSLSEEAPPPCPIKLWFGTILGMGYISTNQLDKASEQLKKALNCPRIIIAAAIRQRAQRKQDRDPGIQLQDHGGSGSGSPSRAIRDSPLRNAAACALRPRKPSKIR